jgi:LysR family transcriptional regulator, glycine cleavage system transcriptional activator
MKNTHASVTTASAQHLPSVMALRAFERSAARLSFRRAADDLAMTPSAVSHQVRGLEQLLGVRLFARVGRTVALTLAGSQYLASVKSALALIENAGRALSPAQGKQREVRISALPFFLSSVVLPRLHEFLAKFPAITLRLEATVQYADFEGSGVDVAIRMGRNGTAGLQVDKLLDVWAIPVCAASLANGSKPIRTAQDLAQHTLIQSSQQPDMWLSWLDNAKVPSLAPAGELWFDNVPLAIEAAERGLGVALAMDPIIRSRPGFGSSLVAPLAVSAKTKLSYFAVCRPEQKDEQVVLALRRWLVQITKDLR